MPPPPSNLPPTPHPLRYAHDAARSVPGNSRRSRPLTYALSIAGIAGSGALIGAILNMNSQRQSRQKQSLSKPPLSPQAQAETEGEGPQSQTRPQLAQGVDHSQAIQTLETKRGQLVAQKLQLERRINDLHETRRRRRRQAEEEEEQEKETTKVK